jgi:hypothetical protein
MIFLIIYVIITAILYVVGYWLFCKSYNNYRYKDRVSFDEYFDDRCALFIMPAFCWPAIVVFFPLILLIGICYILTRKIKEYHNIED